MLNKIEDLEILFKNGNGVYGTVYKCIDKDKNILALKKIKNDDKFKKCAIKEIQILEKLMIQNQNKRPVIDFIGHFTDMGIIYLVFDFMEQNLYQYLKYSRNDPYEYKLNIMYKIIDGLDYIHSFDIIHADLKPENIMYDLTTKKLKIIDFGSSFYEEEKKLKVYIQSRYYRAPEIIYHLEYDKSIDIWSYICIFYELFFNYPLFPGSNEKDMIFKFSELIDVPHDFKEYTKSSFFIKNFFYDSYFHGYEKIKCPKTAYKSYKTYNKYNLYSLLLSQTRKIFPELVESENNYKFINFTNLFFKILKYNKEERLTSSQILDDILFEDLKKI